jgi:hypothetical protein
MTLLLLFPRNRKCLDGKPNATNSVFMINQKYPLRDFHTHMAKQYPMIVIKPWRPGPWSAIQITLWLDAQDLQEMNISHITQ